MKKSLFLLLALFALAYAQENSQDRNISIGGSIGYVRAVFDKFEDYPFEGFVFYLGTSGFIPLTDVAKFGGDISIGYGTASATDEYDVKLTSSSLSLGLTPTIRFGEEKIHTDIGLGISIPLSHDQTIKISGKTHTEKLEPDTDFALVLIGRYNVMGLGLSKVLTSGKEIILSANAFISITEQIEIVPFIKYFTSAGNYSSGTTDYYARDYELRLGIGFDYWL